MIWQCTKLRQHRMSLSSYELWTFRESLWCTTLFHVWPFLFSTVCFNEDKQIWHKSRGNCLQHFHHLTLYMFLWRQGLQQQSGKDLFVIPCVCPHVVCNLFSLKLKTVITSMILTRKYQNFLKHTVVRPLHLEAKYLLPDPLTLLVWGLKWV